MNSFFRVSDPTAEGGRGAGLGSGGGELGFRTQKKLDINYPPLTMLVCPKESPQWARTPELVQNDGTRRRGMRRQEAKETLNQH